MLAQIVRSTIRNVPLVFGLAILTSGHLRADQYIPHREIEVYVFEAPLSATGGRLYGAPDADFWPRLDYGANDATRDSRIGQELAVPGHYREPAPPSGTAVFYCDVSVTTSAASVTFSGTNAVTVKAPSGYTFARAYTAYLYVPGASPHWSAPIAVRVAGGSFSFPILQAMDPRYSYQYVVTHP